MSSSATAGVTATGTASKESLIASATIAENATWRNHLETALKECESFMNKTDTTAGGTSGGGGTSSGGADSGSKAESIKTLQAKYKKCVKFIDDLCAMIQSATVSVTASTTAAGAGVGGPARGLNWLRELCGSIRLLILQAAGGGGSGGVDSLLSLGSPVARLRLLADILVLWSQTSNFSTSQVSTI